MDLNEKTLTPAELKKREEIAKAIERDTPTMPMDKKMAIATAQAKKVAEELSLKQKQLDHNNDGKIDATDLHKVRKHGAKKVAEELSPKQKQLDHNNDGKIDATDLHKVRKHGAKELDEFAIGTKVHHPFLGPKGGEVVKPEDNGFNSAGVKSHESNIHVKGSNGKIYKFAAHSVKPTPSEKELEKMKPLSKNLMRKESVDSVLQSCIESRKCFVESQNRAEVLPFAEYSKLFESVNENIFGGSAQSWLTKGAASMKPETGEKRGRGNPGTDRGNYKIDTKKRQDPAYKAELGKKVMAAKAEGFAARDEFKDAMNSAIKAHQIASAGNTGAIIYKHGGQHHMGNITGVSGAAHETSYKTSNGHSVPVGDVVSTDETEWKKFKNKSVK